MPYTFVATLAGTQYVEKNYQKFCSGPDHSLRLEFEPQNPFDPNAVKVLGGAKGLFIGYLDRGSAARVHRLKSKQPTAEAIFEGGVCNFLSVTLEVDPPAKKKTVQTGVIVGDTIVIGCVVKPKIPTENLQNISGELAIIPDKGAYSIRQMASGELIGMLDAKTAALLERSETEIAACTVFDFSDGHLFVKITATKHLLSDHEWQQKRIAALFRKMPQYLGAHFDNDDMPTENQFRYGLALGIDMRNQTFKNVSKAIDKAQKKGVKPQDPLDYWELEELYRYLSRSSNQRYAFLDRTAAPPRPRQSIRRPFRTQAVQSCEMPTEFKTKCPQCGQHYEAPAEMDGTECQCVKCGHQFTIRLDIPQYVHAQCPKCKTTSVFPPGSSGKKLECPKCHETFVKNSPVAQTCGCLLLASLVLLVLLVIIAIS